MLRAVLFCSALLCMLFSFPALGQYSWFEGYGSAGNDEAMDCVAVSDGLVTVGYFSGDMFISGTAVELSSAGATDGFVMKHDTNGDLEWAVTLGGPVTERPVAVEADGFGNIYVVGNFYGSTTMAGFALNAPDTDAEIYVAKITPIGTIQWVKPVGGINEDIVHDISVRPSGEFAITGTFREYLDAGTVNLTGVDYGEDEEDQGDPSLEMFVLGANASGDWQWAQHGTTESDARGLSIDHSDDHFYLTGQFSDTLNFGALLVNNTIANAGFVSQLSPAGNVNWISRMSAGFTQCHDIVYTGELAVVTGDYIQQMAVFDGDSDIDFFPCPYDNGIFLAAFNPDGSLNWFSSSGSDSPITSQEITLDTDGNLLTAGHFECRFDGYADDSGTGLWRSLDQWDMFVSSYDPGGTRLWERHVGGRGDDRSRGLATGTEATGPLWVGSSTDIAVVPGVVSSYTGDVEAPWCTNLTTNYCGYENYPYLTQYTSNGGADAMLFYVRWPDYQLLDPFRRSGTDCDLSLGSPCFGLSQSESDCSACSDTLTICATPGWIYGYTPFTEVYDMELYTSDWPIWFGSPYQSSSGGSHAITWTSADGCFTYMDTVVVEPVDPDCILLSDGLDVNQEACFPNYIEICDLDSLQLWADLPGGEITGWGTMDPLNPVFYYNTDSVAVISTDVYTVSGIDANGCAVSTSVDVYMGHQITDYQGVLEVIMDGEVVEEGDSLVFCESTTMWAYLLEANDSPWVSLNADADFNLYWDGFLISTNEFEGQVDGGYDEPHFHWTSIDNTGNYTMELIYDVFWDYPCPDSVLTDTLVLNWHVTIFEAPDDLVTISGPDFMCSGECVEYTLSGVTDVGYTNNITNLSDDLTSFEVCEPGYFSISWESFTEECLFDGTVSGIVNPYLPPVIDAVPDHFVICPGDSVMLTTDLAQDYQWFGPLGEPLGNEQELWVSTPGAYVVGVTNLDGCYLESVAADTYAYNTPYLEYTPDSDLCFEDEVLVTILTSEAADVEWADPFSGSALEQIITEPGNYQVTVSFCGITTDFDIEILDTPVITDIYADSYLLCGDGDPVTLWADSTMTEVYWSTGEENEWVITVDEPGEVSITAFNELGCEDTGSTIVYLPEEAQPELGSTNPCMGDDFSLFSGSEVEVYWSLSPWGTDTLGVGSPLAQDALDFSTWYYAMVPDTTCGVLMDSIFVEILDGGINNNDSLLCLPSTLVLDAWSTMESATVSWSPAGQVADAGALQTAVLSDNTTTYDLTLVSPTGCVVTDEVTFTQFVETTTLANDTILCEGDSLWVSVDWPEDYLVEWTGGQTGHVAVFDTTTLIEVLVTSPTGCASTDVLDLIVLQYPVIPLPDDTTVCQTLFLDLDAGNAEHTILWDNGDTVPIRRVNEAGAYSVTINNGPCFSYQTTNVEVLNMPVETITQDTVICFHEPPYTAMLDAGNMGASYTWYTGDAAQEIIVDAGGPGWVEVTLPNGCAQTYEFEVVEFCEGDLFIPNAFTPNQDGNNDVWTIHAYNLLRFEIWVFNRWGEVVYHSTDPTEVWVGDHQGGTHYVPDGVYTYLVKASWPTYDGLETPQDLTGHVTVIR